jgi:hypothetical protein
MSPAEAELRAALAQCVDLIEAWAYGPLMQKAGIEWPHGVCEAPALVNAKRLISTGQTRQPPNDDLDWDEDEICGVRAHNPSAQRGRSPP